MIYAWNYRCTDGGRCFSPQKNTQLKILKMSLKRTLSCKKSEKKKVEEQLVDQKFMQNITMNVYVS